MKKDPLEMEEVDGEVVDVNKVEAALRSAGVELRDVNGEFRDLDDVFLELSSKWDGLTKSQQRYIATMAAGSRQQSRFIAMMQDYGRTMELVNAAYDSDGASTKQFEKTQESLESKLNRLKNAWDEFVLGIMNSDLIKWLVDAGTNILTLINDITSKLGDVGTALSRIGIIFGGLKIGKDVFNSLLGFDVSAKSGLKALIDTLKTGEKGISIFNWMTMIGSSKKPLAEANDLLNMIKGNGTKAITSLKGVGTTLGTTFKGVLSMLGACLPYLLAIGAAIGLIVVTIKAIKFNSATAQLERWNDAAASSAEAAQVCREKYDNLQSSLNNINDKRTILDNLTEGTNEWKQAVLELNNAVLDLLKLYPELNKWLRISENGVLSVDQAGIDELNNKIVAQARHGEFSSTYQQYYSDKIAIDEKFNDERKDRIAWTSDAQRKFYDAFDALTDDQLKSAASELGTPKAFVESYLRSLYETQDVPGADEDELKRYEIANKYQAYGQAAIDNYYDRWDSELQQNEDALKSRISNDIRSNSSKDIDSKLANSLSGVIATGYIQQVDDFQNTVSSNKGLATADLVKKYESQTGKDLNWNIWDDINPNSKVEQMYADLEGIDVSKVKELQMSTEELMQSINSMLISDDILENFDQLAELITQFDDSKNKIQLGGKNYTAAEVASLMDSQNVRSDQLSLKPDEIAGKLAAALKLSVDEAAKLFSYESAEAWQEGIQGSIDEAGDTFKNLESFFSNQLSNSGIDEQAQDIFNNFINGFALSAGEAQELAQQSLSLIATSGIDGFKQIMTEMSDMFKDTGIEGDEVNEILKQFNKTTLKSKESIKALRDKLIKMSDGSKEAQERIDEFISDLESKAGALSTQTVEGNEELLKESYRLARDIGQGEQDRVFSKEDYETIAKAMPEFADKFAEDLDGKYVYLGTSMDELRAAVIENTSAILGNTQDILQSKQATGELIAGMNGNEEIPSLEDRANWGMTNGKLNEDALHDLQISWLQNFLDQAKASGIDLNALGIANLSNDSTANNIGPGLIGPIIDALAGIFSAYSIGEYTNAMAQLGKNNIIQQGLASTPQQNQSNLVQANAGIQSGQITETNINNLAAYGRATAINGQEFGNMPQGQIDTMLASVNELEAAYQRLAEIENQVAASGEEATTGQKQEMANLKQQIIELGNEIVTAGSKINQNLNFSQAMENFSALETAYKDFKSKTENLADPQAIEANIGPLQAALETFMGMKLPEAILGDTEELISLMERLTSGTDDAAAAFDEIVGSVDAYGASLLNAAANGEQIKTSATEVEGQITAMATAIADAINGLDGASFTIESEADFSNAITAMFNLCEQANMTAEEASSLISSVMGSLGFSMHFESEPQSFEQIANAWEIEWKESSPPGGDGSSAWYPTIVEKPQTITQTAVEGGIVVEDANGNKISGWNSSGNTKRTYQNNHNIAKADALAQMNFDNPSGMASKADLYKTNTLDIDRPLPKKTTITPPDDYTPNTFGTQRGAVPTSGGKSSGGGGGSTKDDESGEEPWENPYDWLYNLTQDINAELRVRNRLETQYNDILEDRTKTAKDLYDNTQKQLASIEKQRQLQQEMYDKRVEEMKSRAASGASAASTSAKADSTKTSGIQVISLSGGGGSKSKSDYSDEMFQKYAWFNWEDETIEIDWDAIDKIVDSDFGDALEEYISDLEEIQDQMNEAQDALDEMNAEIRELVERGKDTYLALEDRIYEAIKQQYQDEIDKLSEIDESINNANSKMLSAIQESIEESRQARDNEKAEEELNDKQRRLAYLQQDTSNANALEILQLQKEIEEGQQSYTDQLIDQKISELQKQNDDASEQRQVQIDLMQKSLDMMDESGALWQEVYAIMDSSIDANGKILSDSGLMELLKNVDNWTGLSAINKMVWLDDLTKDVKESLNYLMTGRQLEYIDVPEGQTIEFTTADGQVLSGKVMSNGDVMISDEEGDWLFSQVYQTWDGGFTTFENFDDRKKKEQPVPIVTPSVPKSSGSSYIKSSGGSGSPIVLGGDKEPSNKSTSPSVPPNTGCSTCSGTCKTTCTGKCSKSCTATMADAGHQTTIYDDKLNQIGGVKQSISCSGNCTGSCQNSCSGTCKSSCKDSCMDSCLNSCQGTCDKVAKIKVPKFATGGLNTTTGPAWLDGTFSKPELVLNAHDTQNFLQLRDILRDWSGQNSAGSINGQAYYDVDVNVDSISSDYDVQRLADKIKDIINKEARYRNVNSINFTR